MAATPALGSGECVTGDREPPYSVGWANIYSVPTWMKQTQVTIEGEVDRLKEQGLVDDLMITDAQGNAQTQIQQMQSMIDSDMDVIVITAGSATALNRVIANACDAGIAVVNFDSLVTTDHLTSKISPDANRWGKLAAQWMVDQLDGEGDVIVMNGPAGVAVSEDRREGAQPVLDDNPGIEVVAETNDAYNVAPAQQTMTNLLFSHPDVDGILSLGGALSAGAVLAYERQGREVPPMTGENYRQFLELWRKHDMDAWATMQPNWLGALAVYAAVEVLEGREIPDRVRVPLPIITNDNLDDYLARAEKFPADGYIYSEYDHDLFDKLLNQ